MKSAEWKTYRTRFLVKAKQLSTNLTFVDPLGRQHSGRKGDYLVESDGMLRIAPRQIFEDIYVTITAHEEDRSTGKSDSEDEKKDDREMMPPRKPVQRTHPHRISDHAVSRKFPQPYRDRRVPDSGLGMM